MKRIPKFATKLSLCGAIALPVFMASFAGAAGLYLNEFGTPTMGTAGAGAQAIANDASTSFHNAAGMTRLEGNQLMLTGGLVYTDIRFDPDADTPVPGNDGGQAGGPGPIIGGFYVHSLSDDLKLGVNVLSISAAILDFRDDWTGRYLLQEVEIFTISVNPSIAYRVNKKLSIAGGVALLYGNLDETVAVPIPGQEDGSVNIDGDDTEFTFNLNALYEFTDRTRIGLSYFYEIEPTFGGDVTLDPISLSAGIDATITFPQFIKLGLFHEINEDWAFLGTVGWEEWSAFENVIISTARGDQRLPRNFDNTWYFGAGLQYTMNEDWTLRFGAAYDTNPIDDPKDRTVDMPFDEQIRVACGFNYAWSENINVGGAFTYAYYGEAEIENDLLVGEFKDNDLYFLSMNVSWKF
mgnify:CR=1 FL=1